MFPIFKELTKRIREKKEIPDISKEKITFEEFVELFQKCPIPEIEYTKHFEAFINTLDVDDEGFKTDLKKCYALCSYRLDQVLVTKNPDETKKGIMTGGGKIQDCITSIRLKSVAAIRRHKVMKEILSEPEL